MDFIHSSYGFESSYVFWGIIILFKNDIYGLRHQKQVDKLWISNYSPMCSLKYNYLPMPRHLLLVKRVLRSGDLRRHRAHYDVFVMHAPGIVWVSTDFSDYTLVKYYLKKYLFSRKRKCEDYVK